MSQQEETRIEDEWDVTVIVSRCEREHIPLGHAFIRERGINLSELWERGWRSDFNDKMHYPPEKI